MINKLPWPSLSILAISYISFAASLPPLALTGSAGLEEEAIARSLPEISLWVLAILLALSFAGLLTAPLRQFKRNIVKGFQSDLGLFLALVTLSFFSVLLLSRIYLFYQAFILLCAGALARVDLQTLGFSEWHAFLVLSSTSGMGLALGWVMAYLS
ncbi:hypothetical protein [Roseofilum casamattae]|uniref:DUF4345 domain-containing protein n=1 Tax=Roseofilum casamattae BLCC-M143 TaxID=3022442 RepID=A0ABT7C1B4_9CYAN|nr:hypothetical protein [Roseofilum casamattae]MDJ1184852.1 hypothetical protein [Roseofilum casamattae BLCC-M143]